MMKLTDIPHDSGNIHSASVTATHSESKKKAKYGEKPIPSDIYPVIDTDLGRDNIENDIPDADLNELQAD